MRAAIFGIVTLGAMATIMGCPPAGKSGGEGADSSSPLLRKVAPDVALKMKDAAWRPSNAMGKVLVIDYWATWCVPCRDSFPKLDAIYRKHQGEGLEVVAINEDHQAADKKKVDAFVRDTGATFAIAFDDEDGSAAEKYGVKNMPTQFVIDRHGVVRGFHPGYHPGEMDALESEIVALLKEPP